MKKYSRLSSASVMIVSLRVNEVLHDLKLEEIMLPYKFYVLGQIGLSKQCRPRSDCFFKVSANSADQDQTASDQGLCCLPFHQRLLDALMQCYIKLFYFQNNYGNCLRCPKF